jgi:hypothetical protein
MTTPPTTGDGLLGMAAHVHDLCDRPGDRGPDDAFYDLASMAKDYVRQTREAMRAAIRASSPSERWVAIPHEEWRNLLAIIKPGDVQPERSG